MNQPMTSQSAQPVNTMSATYFQPSNQHTNYAQSHPQPQLVPSQSAIGFQPQPMQSHYHMLSQVDGNPTISTSFQPQQMQSHQQIPSQIACNQTMHTSFQSQPMPSQQQMTSQFPCHQTMPTSFQSQPISSQQQMTNQTMPPSFEPHPMPSQQQPSSQFDFNQTMPTFVQSQPIKFVSVCLQPANAIPTADAELSLVAQVGNGTYGKDKFPERSPFHPILDPRQIFQADECWNSIRESLKRFERDPVLIGDSYACDLRRNPKFWNMFSHAFKAAPMFGAHKDGRLNKAVVAIEEDYTQSELYKSHSDRQAYKSVSYQSLMTIRSGFSDDEILECFVAQFNENELQKRRADK
ncbi:hypothetical protein THAOC_34089 [Thalassiosira oceanica]|uniref:Uncharacterized protein n=1 Tax=Thalassiosira oceanica TaxID=159749 RepID=K0RKP3_THAOC|nr:hypothetical protein THAOC_34089 [Thalassiosira oceanica]|eukprot:EJK47212.1 hypothetical protein THAOC_34089 [Thalassiosira oceanica]